MDNTENKDKCWYCGLSLIFSNDPRSVNCYQCGRAVSPLPVEGVEDIDVGKIADLIYNAATFAENTPLAIYLASLESRINQLENKAK